MVLSAAVLVHDVCPSFPLFICLLITQYVNITPTTNPMIIDTMDERTTLTPTAPPILTDIEAGVPTISDL